MPKTSRPRKPRTRELEASLRKSIRQVAADLSTYLHRTNAYSTLGVVAVECPDLMDALLRQCELIGGAISKLMPMVQSGVAFRPAQPLSDGQLADLLNSANNVMKGSPSNSFADDDHVCVKWDKEDGFCVSCGLLPPDGRPCPTCLAAAALEAE